VTGLTGRMPVSGAAAAPAPEGSCATAACVPHRPLWPLGPVVVGPDAPVGPPSPAGVVPAPGRSWPPGAGTPGVGDPRVLARRAWKRPPPASPGSVAPAVGAPGPGIAFPRGAGAPSGPPV